VFRLQKLRRGGVKINTLFVQRWSLSSAHEYNLTYWIVAGLLPMSMHRA